MLRRTKDTLINGKPIVELPPRHVGTVDCEFDSSERAFYNAIETKVRSRLDNMQAEKQMNYTSMLVLLLRLRQGNRYYNPGLDADNDYHVQRVTIHSSSQTTIEAMLRR